MVRWSNEGTLAPSSIFEAATLHRSVRVVCACGHSSTFWAAGLWWHFHKRRWADGFSLARERFWCRRCASRLASKIRPVSVDAVDVGACDVRLPDPDGREWKRMLRRLR